MKKCICGNQCAGNAKFCPKCGYRFPFPRSLVTIVVVVFGLFVLALMLGNVSSTPPTSASTAEVKSKEQFAKENKRFEQCRAKLKKAQNLDLLHDLKMDPLPRVVVGPTFYTIPLDAKQGFADTVNCFLMTGEDKYINFDLLDYRTGHVVAEYSYGKLSVK